MAAITGARGQAYEIDAATRRQMIAGKSWRDNYGCPDFRDLRLLLVPYKDFTGARHVGKMIVHRTVAERVLNIFEALYKADFKIARMELISDRKYRGNDNRSMAANNTSAFNCRKTTGGSRLSEHAKGWAIDINPVQNPYVTRRGTVLPRESRRKRLATERDRQARNRTIGLIIRRLNGPRVVKIFEENGFKWGGDWRSIKDYQHFSITGR